MCGICGIAALDGRPVDRSALQAMNAALTHRGPDDEGYYVKGGIGLAMRRLSIVDLSGGRQPIANESGTKWVVCNGEIYSHPRLRRSLEHHGHKFRTNSDVESILHAYEEYGEDFVRFLNGMFAFAIWDEDAQRLVLGRDRTGIKPLYYLVSGDTLYFSSELRSLIQNPEIPRELDSISLQQYLAFEYVPSPRSIFKNIKKLPPGCVLEFSRSKGVVLKPYWDLTFQRSESRPPLMLKELKSQLIETLENSIELELMSDVPMGVFLSGGLDSSAVAALAMRKTSAPLKTFTLKFEDASFDESGFAQTVADHIRSEHHTKVVTPQMIIEAAERIDRIIDEPIGDSSIIPTYLLSQFAREHVKVVLGGDGGDELFAGYPTLKAHRMVELYERIIPRAIRANLLPRLVSNLPVSFNNLSFDFKAKRFLSGRGIPAGVRHHRWLGSFTEEEQNQVLHPDLHYREIDAYDPVREAILRSDAKNPYNQLLYCDMKLYLEGDILAKVDRASMANSLEVRVPLLNLYMLNFAQGLPFEYKLRRFESKFLLKRALESFLPRSIIYRKKKGFNIPVGKLFQNELKPMLCDYLSPDRIRREGLFNEKETESLIADHLSSKADNRKQLWTLLSFQRWMEAVAQRPALSGDINKKIVSNL